MRKFKNLETGAPFQRPDDPAVYYKEDDETYAKRGGKPREGKDGMEVIPVVIRRQMVVTALRGIVRSNVFVPQGAPGKVQSVNGDNISVVFDYVFTADNGAPGYVLSEHRVSDLSPEDLYYQEVSETVERFKEKGAD